MGSRQLPDKPLLCKHNPTTDKRIMTRPEMMTRQSSICPAPRHPAHRSLILAATWRRKYAHPHSQVNKLRPHAGERSLAQGHVDAKRRSWAWTSPVKMTCRAQLLRQEEGLAPWEEVPHGGHDATTRSPPYSEARVGPSETIQQHGKPRPREGRIPLPMPLEAALPLPRASHLAPEQLGLGLRQPSALDLVPHAVEEGHAILVFA